MILIRSSLGILPLFASSIINFINSLKHSDSIIFISLIDLEQSIFAEMAFKLFQDIL